MKHPILNEFDEIDIDYAEEEEEEEEEVEQNDVENHNIITPNLGPGMISAGQNPDIRYVYY